MISKYRVIAVIVALVMLASAFVVIGGALSGQTADASTGQGVWLARNVGEAQDTIGFDATAKRARFILPKGLRSADGTAYWAAFYAGDTTALHAFNVNDGSIAATVGLDGIYNLGAVSATGKWLALKRAASESEQATWAKTLAWKTEIVVIDATTGKTTRTITLDGNFDVDALDAKGTRLYVIEHLPAIKPDHYQVRAYDLTSGSMLEGVLADKRNLDEVMAGYPTDAVASADGSWLFTVYVGMQEEHAFIHALNLTDGYAWCIDLPSGDGNSAMLENYALAVAPDGHTIYASNAVLGVLAVADVNNIGEPTVTRFAPAATKFEATGAPVKGSVVTPDGKHVYMSNGGTVWGYDVVAKKTAEMRHGLMPIVSLGWSVEANTLLLARADHVVSTLADINTTPGQTVSAQSK